MGITQMLCLKYGGKNWASGCRWQRTSSSEIISEASMIAYLRRNLFRFMALQGDLTITKIISSKQYSLDNQEIDLFAEKIFDCSVILKFNYFL